MLLLQGTQKQKQKILSKISLTLLILFTLLLSKAANSLSTETLKGSLINTLNANSFSMAPVRTTSQTTEIEHFLTITGTASRSVTLDLILIQLNVETLNLDLSTSYRENIDASNKLSQVFIKLGIPDKNITTTSYGTRRKTRSVQDPIKNTWTEILEGWEVSNQMQVILSDLQIVSDLIDKSLAVGPVQVTSIAFDYSKNLQKKLKDMLLPLAAEDAIKRAKISGKALQVVIDDVKNCDVDEFSPVINTQQQQKNLIVVAREAASNADAPPAIFVGRSTLDVSINVKFIITKE